MAVVPLDQAPGETAVAEECGRMDTDEHEQCSDPKAGPPSQEAEVIATEMTPAGEKPPDDPNIPSSLSVSETVAPKGDINKRTLEAMAAVHQRKLDKQSQKPRFTCSKAKK